MFKMLLASVALLAAGVVGCTTTQPQSSIASLEIALTTAEAAATAYANLPACGGASAVCSDPATVTKIKAADNKAYAAVKAARAGASAGGSNGSVSTAVAAVAAFRALLPR